MAREKGEKTATHHDLRMPLEGSVGQPTPEQPDPARLGRRLVSTMRFTFAVAQGNLGQIHSDITRLTAGKYRASYDKELLQAAVATVSDADMQRLRLPGRGKHSENLTTGGSSEPQSDVERRQLIAAQFHGRWDAGMGTFVRELFNPSNRYEPGNKFFDLQLVELVDQMVEQGLSYLRETREVDGKIVPYAGRPIGEHSGRDPRQSFVRDYLIGGDSMGDPVIDAMLSDARAVLTERTPENATRYVNQTSTEGILSKLYESKLPSLAAQWEHFHPGEQFLDPGQFASTRLAAALQVEKQA